MEEKGKKGGKQDWFSDQKVIFWEVVICPKSHTLVSESEIWIYTLEV